MRPIGNTAQFFIHFLTVSICIVFASSCTANNSFSQESSVANTQFWLKCPMQFHCSRQNFLKAKSFLQWNWNFVFIGILKKIGKKTHYRKGQNRERKFNLTKKKLTLPKKKKKKIILRKKFSDFFFQKSIFSILKILTSTISPISRIIFNQFASEMWNKQPPNFYHQVFQLFT